MEEPALLMAVQRIVGGVEVEHDLGRRLVMGLQEQIHEQSFDRLCIVADLVIARRFPDAAVLQPVQRGFAGKHRTVFPFRRQALREKCKHRIMAKRVVVVDVLVSQGDCPDALPDQRAYAVNRQIRIAAIDEAGGNPVEQADRSVHVAKQQGAGIRRDRLRRRKRRRLCGCRSLQIRSAGRYSLFASDPLLNLVTTCCKSSFSILGADAPISLRYSV